MMDREYGRGRRGGADYGRGRYGDGDHDRERWSGERGRGQYGSSRAGQGQVGAGHYGDPYGGGQYGQGRYGGRGQDDAGRQGGRQSGAGAARGPFAGRGPRGYQRSDQRLLEDVSDRLTDHPDIDASDIEVAVTGGIVTLAGTVDDRRQKRLAEDAVEDLPGVRDVQNQLQVKQRGLGDQLANIGQRVANAITPPTS